MPKLTKEKLRAGIDRLGLTQEQAAARLGVPQRTLERWLSGQHKVPGPAVTALRLDLGELEPLCRRVLPAA